MTEKSIHLVFKTHLDIGFTDHAAKVRQQYHDQFIPQAIATGEHFFAENPEQPEFIWTTGAWLIWDHLNSQAPERVQRLEQAIERGLITWHGLPFTTHSELMSPAVFRAGLSYAQELDKRFGRTTTAAKMTDVPGHTLGIVPLLAKVGIRFLHLGVNTASPVPDVPPIFRWQAPGGEEVVVMYQGSYGATEFPAGDDVGLSFAHTNDNIGPQSVGQTVEVLRQLRTEYPGAMIAASTLDNFGAAMWARKDDFPVVTQEIGDSWIHGAASDPVKLARYRALQRIYDGFDSISDRRRAFGRGLCMVAEHTWGVDIKTYLRDETAWDRQAFEAARKNDYRFAYVEKSWVEQRDYLDQAVAQLDTHDRQNAKQALDELNLATRGVPVPGTLIADNGWTAVLNTENGDLCYLTTPEGASLEGQNGSLMGYRHESYDGFELQKHLDSYLQHHEVWAVLDHDKPGLASARRARTAVFEPKLGGIIEGRRAVIAMPPDASSELGAPDVCELSIRGLSKDRVELTLMLCGKPANRMPEGGFLHLSPAKLKTTKFKKMGLWHRAGDEVRRGGGQLQAVEEVALVSDEFALNILPLDAALVCARSHAFMPFQPDPPDWSQGVRFNLYNNKWGTNFPMWWEGAVAFRFQLSVRQT